MTKRLMVEVMTREELQNEVERLREKVDSARVGPCPTPEALRDWLEDSILAIKHPSGLTDLLDAENRGLDRAARFVRATEINRDTPSEERKQDWRKAHFCRRCDEDTPTTEDGKCTVCTKYKVLPNDVDRARELLNGSSCPTQRECGLHGCRGLCKQDTPSPVPRP